MIHLISLGIFSCTFQPGSSAPPCREVCGNGIAQLCCLTRLRQHPAAPALEQSARGRRFSPAPVGVQGLGDAPPGSLLGPSRLPGVSYSSREQVKIKSCKHTSSIPLTSYFKGRGWGRLGGSQSTAAGRKR